MVSTYDYLDGMLKDFEEGRGRRVVTFSNILRDKALPVAEALDFMLKQGQMAMQRPVEIEFAANIADKPSANGIKGHIYWLQIRPIIDKKNLISDTVLDRPDTDLILRSTTAMGNGMIEGVKSIVYVRPDSFDSLKNAETVDIIRRINNDFASRGEGYILIGPGRWGSSDAALGIPVRWTDISAARLIAEASLPGYHHRCRCRKWFLRQRLPRRTTGILRRRYSANNHLRPAPRHRRQRPLGARNGGKARRRHNP